MWRGNILSAKQRAAAAEREVRQLSRLRVDLDTEVEGLVQEAGMRAMRLVLGRMLQCRVGTCLARWRSAERQDAKRSSAMEASLLSEGNQSLESRLHEALGAMALNEEIGAAAEEEINRLTTHNASLQREVDSLKASLEEALREGERSTSAAKEQRVANESLEAQVVSLQGAHLELQEAKARVDKDLRLAQAQIMALSAERDEKAAQLGMAMDTLEALNRHHRQLVGGPLVSSPPLMVPG